MRLTVQHRTEYAYSAPQARLIQLLRLTPGNHGGQSIVSWRIDVDCDARLKSARDGYGNETMMLYIDGPLDRIVIDVAGEVLTEDRAGIVQGTPEPLPPLHFLQPTPLTTADAAIAAFVRDLGLSDDALTGAHLLADTIHDRLALAEPAAGTDQSAAARFAEGTADPQGAAHLLIAAARAARYPARYVAGHLYRPDADSVRAAHGWAELYVEGYGWIGFDPHEGHCPTESHIRVATGLDHTQAAPISGARIGGGHEALTVDIRVAPERRRD